MSILGRKAYLAFGGLPLALLLLLVTGLWWGLDTSVAQAQSNKDTGRIQIHKTVCDDIGDKNTCKGRDNSLDNQDVDFTITNSDGVTVTISENSNGNGNLGNGSQGMALSGPLEPGTYTVCEVSGGTNVTPRPPAGGGGSTGGTNQDASGDCIVVEVNNGVAQVKFLNEAAPGQQPIPTPTPTNVPDDDDEDNGDDGDDEEESAPAPTSTPVPQAAAQVAPMATPVPAAQPVVTVLAAEAPAPVALPAAGSGGLADAGLPISLIAVNALAVLGLGLAALAGWRRRE